MDFGPVEEIREFVDFHRLRLRVGRISRVDRHSQLGSLGVEELEVVIEVVRGVDQNLGECLPTLLGMGSSSGEGGLILGSQDPGHPSAIGREKG